MHIDHLTILLRIMAALACGSLLGAEREYRGREAGLKSHAGLAVACCLAILVSAFGFSDAVTAGLISLDPSRIAAGVEGGIGFACAAVIWRSRSKVIGLTTAINIWATANVGMACGAGMFFAGALITGAMLFIHLGLGTLEKWCFPRHDAFTLTVTVVRNNNTAVASITKLIAESRAQVFALHAVNGQQNEPATLEFEIGKCHARSYLSLLMNVQQLDGVTAVSCNGLSGCE